MSRGGHKYSLVGSKGKLCPVKLAFMFHMNDFWRPTEICSRQWQLWGCENLLSSKVRTRTMVILWYDLLSKSYKKGPTYVTSKFCSIRQQYFWHKTRKVVSPFEEWVDCWTKTCNNWAVCIKTLDTWNRQTLTIGNGNFFAQNLRSLKTLRKNVGKFTTFSRLFFV